MDAASGPRDDPGGRDLARGSRLTALLDAASTAIRRGDLQVAVRLADAAARISPRNSEILQLLAGIHLARAEPDLALERLAQADCLRPGPEIDAARIEALLMSGRSEEAADMLAEALARFAVEPGDRLAVVARHLMVGGGRQIDGWVGVSRALEVWGETVASVGPLAIGLSDDGRAPLRCPTDLVEIEAGLVRFTATIPSGGRGRICVGGGGVRLLGQGASFPPDFALDGRIWREPERLRGWVGLGWSAGVSPTVVLTDDQGETLELISAPDPATPVWHRFELDLGAAMLCGGVWRVSVRLPDGSSAALPDSPVIVDLPPSPRPAPLWARCLDSVRRRLAGPNHRRPIDIIVPVYEGLSETLDCLTSVTRTVGAQAEVIVIDDASPNRELVARLQALAEAGAITLLRNVCNLGFPGTVNRGLALHPDRDVVILNADTEVFPGWLDRLRAAAYSAADVGTVTPLTNSGAIASYPAQGGDCDAERAALIARLAAEAHDSPPVEIPTGVGFCMFVRRDCLAQTGHFDAVAFGRGYGEENDFCFRAARAGWRHLLIGDVFVRHVGGRSFGRDASALLQRNLWILNRRHPGYDEAVQAYLVRRPAHRLRRRLDEALLREDRRRAVLIVTHDLGGGVDRFVRDRARLHSDQGIQVFYLRPQGASGGVRLEADDQRQFEDLIYEAPAEASDLFALLGGLDLAAIEFHHFLNLPPELLERLLTLGVPYDVYIHDYIWICPRITLIGPDGRYCGEPNLGGCQTCLAAKEAAPLAGLSVTDLRLRSSRWLVNARRVVSPSHDAADRFTRRFGGLEVQVQPWEAPILAPPRPNRPADGKVKVAIIGAIGRHKGYEVIRECARDAAERGLPLEFVVVGYTEDDAPLIAAGDVFVTGAYEEDEIGRLIARESPDVALFASVWPETWCFALSHALGAGLPIVAFDIGAIAERLRASTAPCALLPLEAGAADLNQALLALADAPLRSARSEIRSSRGGPADEPPVLPVCGSRSGAAAADIFVTPGVPRLPPPAPSSSEPQAMTPRAASSELTVTAEVLTLNKGVYLFAVQLAAPRRVGEDGDLILPAIHVGPGPGVASESIEIMTGPRTDGCWLYEPRDVLVIKVRSSPTPMLLTSVRSPGMAPLEVTVERIDVKHQPDGPPAAAPPPLYPALAAPLGPTAAQVAEAGAPQGPPWQDARGPARLRTQITVHVQQRGDLAFVDEFWAGAPGSTLAVEGFSILPLETLAPDQIEYKALNASGVETPWLSEGGFCGTRGVAAPLVGFALRLTGGAEERYDCEYRGAFSSGRVVGPIINGAPCRAVVAGDHLEAIQVAIVERRRPADPPALDTLAPEPTHPAAAQRQLGPRFSVFRESLQ
jgi:GT2 family glycosyltransferase